MAYELTEEKQRGMPRGGAWAMVKNWDILAAADMCFVCSLPSLTRVLCAFYIIHVCFLQCVKRMLPSGFTHVVCFPRYRHVLALP